MPTLLDTHAWVWWVAADRRLSSRARATITRSAARRDLWISLISTWEVAKRVEKGQLTLDRPLDQWLDDALAKPGLGVWEMTRRILVDSCELPQPFHGDPADQIIVATARRHAAMLVTRDEAIARYPHVQTIW
jgi:PIN domain nuclease of toxin-antitoxin system